jgi:anti-sigma factor RsiW
MTPTAMTAAPECDKVLLVQAELDGELDAAEAAALAAHRAGCPICQAAAIELVRARSLIGDGLHETMPADLRVRMLARIAAARREQAADSPAPAPGRSRFRRDWAGWSRGWWGSLGSFGVGAACAAVLAFLVWAPGEASLADQVVAGHIRALQPGHLADIASTDRHTVKPWFDGRIDFAPPVKDLVADRFPLEGGRLDYLAGRPVAAMVYRRDRHVVDLFVWPADPGGPSPAFAQVQGYNVVHWTADGMTLWAVSDLEPGQLREFAEAWRRSP